MNTTGNIPAVSRSFPALLTGLLVSLFALTTAAQLPELGSPSTGSGQSTSARFFGGATADGGETFLENFQPWELLDIVGAIEVEPGHVGSVGNIYVVASDGQYFYQRLPDTSFLLWDGDVATLQAAVADTSLTALEELAIIEELAFEQVGVTDLSMLFFLAYDSQLEPGEIFYSGSPVAVNIASMEADAFQLYQDTVSAPIIQTRCIVCHVSGGLAGSTRLVYTPAPQPDYQLTNYDMLSQFIVAEPGGSELILSKPQGMTHGGGVVLPPGSAELEAFTAFVLAVQQSAGGGGGNAQALFGGVDMLDNRETLRKASLLFAGRLPTDAEFAAVAEADEAGLRQAIRELMAEDGFENFLLEGANDRLLTQAFSRAVFAVVDRYYYPNSRQYFRQRNLPESDARMVSEALALEPLKLISHVVRSERPYTEILTADYIMVNPWSAGIYGGNVQFDDRDDPYEWREGEITEYYRCTICTRNNEDSYPNYNIPTDYPHAGVLNSPAFLARFPSTSTNRNRARARWAYYFFLGVDIEGLSERTTDPDALADENNPTLNNPNCTVCHDIMDPVAGTFQNYGDDGRYRDRRMGLDSLPGSYKTDPQGLYQRGDTWYADMLAPGFGQLPAPDPDNSLQWLAGQMAADPRFGSGTVNFWYPAVIGREPLAEPENPEDADYAAKAAAYDAERQLIQTIADDFVNGSHGNGAYNLKDLLVDLAMSGYFRARSAEELAADHLLQLQDLGFGQLLTPEQLDRKLLETTGFSWRYGRFNTLTDVYGLLYGGIDSFGITERATDLTAMMSTVVTVMANETSCPMVAQDFGRPQEARLLFPYVELSSLPTSHGDSIRTNLQYLHERLLGESLALDDPEIEATFMLFTETWQARMAAGKGAGISSETELCILENAINPVTTDSDQTLRSWAVVLNYLLRDYRFIHE